MIKGWNRKKESRRISGPWDPCCLSCTTYVNRAQTLEGTRRTLLYLARNGLRVRGSENQRVEASGTQGCRAMGLVSPRIKGSHVHAMQGCKVMGSEGQRGSGQRKARWGTLLAGRVPDLELDDLPSRRLDRPMRGPKMALEILLLI
jgi:hypothetical protein